LGGGAIQIRKEGVSSTEREWRKDNGKRKKNRPQEGFMSNKVPLLSGGKEQEWLSIEEKALFFQKEVGRT